MKIFALLIEPANYTLATIKRIYEPRGVEYAYLFGASKASSVKSEALTNLNFIKRIKYFWQILKSHDAFVINDYTQRIDLEFIFLNLLFFRKPFAIESDTELRIPINKLKRLVKWVWLHFLFTRKCCYGFPGGFYDHRKLFTYYGMSEGRVITMPMQVDNVIYNNFSKEMANNKFRFGYLGRLVSHKNVDKIIAAMRGMTNVELVVVGTGDEYNALKGESKDLPVAFTGALFGEEKIKILHSFDCLILPSSYEPWGLVINEALASGIPVIVSDSVGCRHDLVEATSTHGETGIVVKTENVEVLSEAMSKMCNDRALWQKFHENALKRMEYWDYDLYGKQFDSWIKKVSE